MHNVFLHVTSQNYKKKAEHGHLAIHKHRTEQFKRSLAFSGPKIWNNIDFESCM